MSLRIVLSSSPSPLKRPVCASGKHGAEAKKRMHGGKKRKLAGDDGKGKERDRFFSPSILQLILTGTPFFVRCTSKGTELTEEGSH